MRLLTKEIDSPNLSDAYENPGAMPITETDRLRLTRPPSETNGVNQSRAAGDRQVMHPARPPQMGLGTAPTAAVAG